MQPPSSLPPMGQQPPYQQQAYYYPPFNQQPGYMPGEEPLAQGNIKFKYGLIFGGILALLSLSVNILNLTGAAQFVTNLAMPFQNNIDLFDLVYVLVWSVIQGVIAWIIYGIAGFMAAKRAGQVRTGVSVCLWATLWYLIVDIVLIMPFTIISYLQAGIPPGEMMQSFFSIHFFLTLADIIFFDSFLALTVGLGIGAIGASIGKSSASGR
jgi:hypothetical protein